MFHLRQVSSSSLGNNKFHTLSITPVLSGSSWFSVHYHPVSSKADAHSDITVSAEFQKAVMNRSVFKDGRISSGLSPYDVLSLVRLPGLGVTCKH